LEAVNHDAPHLSFRPAVEVFDAAVRLGHPRDAWIADTDSPADLFSEMDERGVARALVYHVHAETLSPRVGQEMLHQQIREHSRLTPQTCVLPSDDSLALLEELEAARLLHSVRLSYDARQRLIFTPEFYGAICEWLQERRIPLFVPAEGVELAAVAHMARAFPRLSIVLAGVHYTSYLWVRPLLRCAATIHLELSRYEAFDQVTELVAEFGAERLIYGSGYPLYAMGPMLFYLHRCELSERDLSLICAGNLRRLLGRGADE
jgi:hypothetical protein